MGKPVKQFVDEEGWVYEKTNENRFAKLREPPDPMQSIADAIKVTTAQTGEAQNMNKALVLKALAPKKWEHTFIRNDKDLIVKAISEEIQ